MDEKFCCNLRESRKACCLTQKQVADKLNVVESCYANWEQGRTEPNIEMLRKLSEIFKIKIDDLING
ncbi:MAG: helix-turn-helix transcriptional regulator [Clostridia bacterium]|nr:helix-turn-helix transcriptional regulator [Clostridia bacterium]